MSKKLKILVRFDDICPTMNWEQWNKAKKILDEKDVTALLGVIPDCKDPDLNIDKPREDFWTYIKELNEQGFVIAMHGYQHVFSLKADGIITHNKISEFAGLPYEVQLEKVAKGKEILNNHGIETDVFFAPAHSYDDNTIRACSACGFKYISDGYSRCPYIRHGIKMIPCRVGMPNYKKDQEYATAILHAHEWTWDSKVDAYSKFEDLLINHSSEIVPWDIFKEWEIGSSQIEKVVEKVYYYYSNSRNKVLNTKTGRVLRKLKQNLSLVRIR